MSTQWGEVHLYKSVIDELVQKNIIVHQFSCLNINVVWNLSHSLQKNLINEFNEIRIFFLLESVCV